MNFDIGETEQRICERVKALFAGDRGGDAAQSNRCAPEANRVQTLHGLASLAQTGYLTPGLADGRNSVSLVVIREQLAGLAPSLFLSVEYSTRIFGCLVAAYGTPEQKDAILPALANGNIIGAVALSEQGMNIDNDPIETVAVPSTDGWRLNGAKSHVLNAAIADRIAVAGRVADEPDTVFFLIEKDSHGLHVGQPLATLGLEGAVISPIHLKDCPVKPAHVIRSDRNNSILRRVRSWEDQVLAAAGLGLMQRAFDAAQAYAKSHKTGGKPIIAYQEIGFKLAEMLTIIQTAQLLAYRAAWMSESRDRESDTLTHCAKVFCAESAERIASEALQILGGRGYVEDNPAASGYRDAKYLQIAGTSTEISRMKIGDAILARQ
jgi:alkylation response protein AidB-like acyl-CoA dehydrogenase